MRARTMAALMVLAIASGCASRPVGVLIPTGTSSAGTTEVDMLVATTRAPSLQPGVLFGGERASKMSSADITVSIPPDAVRTVGQVQWPKKLPANPAREFSTVEVKPLKDSTEIQQWVKHNLPPSRRLLIFVHGFNNRYEDAIYRFAQIVHDSRADVAPVIFTWPSRGSIFDYNYDKESTNYSAMRWKN